MERNVSVYQVQSWKISNLVYAKLHSIYWVTSVDQVQDYIEVIGMEWDSTSTKCMMMSSIRMSPSLSSEPKYLHMGQLCNIGVNLYNGWLCNYVK